jgi:putative transposase
MASKYPKINPGTFAHICNRAVGNEVLFRRNEDYDNWLERVEKFIIPVAEIHAFSVMENHYHLVLRSLDTTSHDNLSKQVSRLQSTYGKGYNNIYSRKGGLFMSPYNRKPIKDEAHLLWAIWYTHRNPLHHGITENWQDWKYSSYPQYINNKPGFVTTKFCMELFGGMDQMKAHHNMNAQAFQKNKLQFSFE